MFRSRYYTISHLGILFELSLMRVLEEVSKKGDPLLVSVKTEFHAFQNEK